MKQFLLASFIVGVVVFLLDCLGFNFNYTTIAMFMLLILVTMFTLMYVNLIENPEKLKERHARYTILFRNTEEAKLAAGNSSYNFAKISYPIIIIAVLGQIGTVISRIIKKVNAGTFAYGGFTFILGIILFTIMIIILIINLSKKELLITKENIRKNAYIF